jgi:D-glycero-D-manno-heptose 1,7-bisphosphate phosphatase
VTGRRFVLLDRDGTIIVERHYLSDPNHVELLPGAMTGLRQLNKLGLGLVVVTNQSGVGRGFFDEGQLDRIHGRMYELLVREGVILDGIYYCPHVPEDECDCRKPGTKLVRRAAQIHAFDPVAAFVIGDKDIDIELGINVGATTLLVRTGYGAQVATDPKVNADYVVDDLAAAAAMIETLMTTPEGSRANGIPR